MEKTIVEFRTNFDMEHFIECTPKERIDFVNWAANELVLKTRKTRAKKR